MDRSAVHLTQVNVFSPIQSMGITYWAKGGQYRSETKVTAAYAFRENVMRAHFQAYFWNAALEQDSSGHVPHKDAVVHLRSWLVHCSASVKAAQPAAIPRLFP